MKRFIPRFITVLLVTVMIALSSSIAFFTHSVDEPVTPPTPEPVIRNDDPIDDTLDYHNGAYVENNIDEDPNEDYVEYVPPIFPLDFYSAHNFYGGMDLISFHPQPTENTAPRVMLSDSDVRFGGETFSTFDTAFQRETPSDFGFGSDYTDIPGVLAFRGNNFRDTASFGYANIVNQSFSRVWSRQTGSLTAPDGAVWTGHGWTGQPLIIKWPRETRQIKQNMHEWARNQEDLVEVVYPGMDGFIYFSELETGRDTRDRLFIGFTFKGSGALDPRGYPLLYVGAGYNSARGSARIFIISLIDGSVLHEFSHGDPFAFRNWPMADASPLICSENDRLFFPSENGVLYIIDLHTNFDRSAGTISIEPSTVRWRYRGHRSMVNSQFWLGFESSPVIWREYMFLAENGGHFMCININTLQPVWVKDTLDDTNTTPVLSIENGHPYIYISTAFHGNGWRAPATGTAPTPVWKVDAISGETVWEAYFRSHTVRSLSGGVQGSMAIGNYELSDLIFVPIARAPTIGAGLLVALNKHTGETVWEFQTAAYSWSSPVIVYTNQGKGYIVYTTVNGRMFLLDGLTGELLDTMELGSTVEASPAVYGNMIVIGTRGQTIFGVKIT